MSKKIIIAGGGHGGIAAAAILAANGLDVTVYEAKSEGTLGYDWTDIFAPKALQTAGMKMPDNEMFEYKKNMTFYSPNQKSPLTQDVPEDQREIKMERKDIYSHFINHAKANGVKFVYDCKINAAKMHGDRVVGIQTNIGDFYADLVIDAAGLNSPIRTKLPKMCLIENQAAPFEQFYVYRAFYNKAQEPQDANPFKIYMLPQGKLGIAWVANEEETADLLIGRFKPFGMKEVEETAQYLRQTNPHLGTQVKRGGQMVNIPVRQPLSVMVCDGYAAIGDSAFMTVPIIGSGIANSLKAAKILADTILKDTSFAYSAETLWDYQVKYYKTLGADLAPLASVKNFLAKITTDELDYIFEKGILTAKEFTIGADSTSVGSILKMSPSDLIERAKNICADKELLGKILALGIQIGRVSAVTSMMPKKWNKEKIASWAKRYQKLFEVEKSSLIRLSQEKLAD